MKLKPLKIIKEKDIHFLKSIAKTGLITKDLLSNYEISNDRFQQHLLSENIVMSGRVMVFGILKNIYILSDNTKKQMKYDYGIGLYRSDLTQVEHDYVLSKVYSKLSLAEKESWVTENMLKELFDEETTVDGLYRSDSGYNVGVEIISENYTKQEIEDKKAFISKYCDSFILINTKEEITLQEG
jgi:hypothetical protein